MNRTTVLLLSLAAASMLTASCRKNDGLSPTSATTTVTAFSDEGLSAKTSLGASNSVIWSTADHISLFYRGPGDYAMADFACTGVSGGGKIATFTGTSQAEGASSYVALYPYDAEAGCAADGKLAATLRGSQTSAAGTFDPRAAIATARSTDKDRLHFRNEVSLAGIKPQESGISSVTIIGTRPMTGEFELAADGSVTTGKMSRSVRLSGEMSSGTTYYAAVLPGDHTGLKIVLGKDDGTFASFSGPAFTFGRNGICTLFEGGVSAWKTSETLFINEVQCGPDGPGIDGKKIEIYNPNDVAVPLYGWTIVKDDSRLFAFPEGSSIAAHGYYVVTCRQEEETATTATFGISGDRGFNLKLCHGAVIDELDNLNPVKVIVDGYTYGRQTDGGGPWVLFSSGTIGSDNSAGTVYVPEPTKTGVALNEIDAVNGWVELKNTTASAVSLSGFKAYLDETHKPLWMAESDATIPADGYFIFNISLSANKNMKLVVEDASGDIAGQFTRGVKASGWGRASLPENASWSFSQINGQWVYALPTKAAANGVGTADIEQGSKLILNEINGSYSDGNDYIEIYNPGVSTEYLDGFKIRRMRLKNGMDDEQTLWKGTSGVTLAPGAYLTFYYMGDIEDNKTYPYRLQRDFSARKNTYIWLQDDMENQLDVFRRGVRNTGWNHINMQKVEDPGTGKAYSYSRAGGLWVYAVPTPDAPNAAKAGDIDQTMCPVVINEINMPGNWVELHNMGNAPFDINGLQLRWSRVKGGKADNQTAWEATSSTVIPAGGYLSVSSTKVDLGAYTDRNIHIRLRSGDRADFTGEKIVCDDFKRGTEGANWTTVILGTTIARSIVRVPDGSGDWYLGNASKASTNGSDKSGGLCPEVDQ